MGSGSTKQQASDHTHVPQIPNDYPHPKPSSKLKRDIVRDEDLVHATERAKSVPVNATKSYEALVSHLVGDATTELEVAWSVYVWLGTLDPLEFGRHKPGDTPTGYMRIIWDNHGDMATFYAIICRRASLKCAILEGVTKNEYYDVGQSELELASARDRWVAVYVSDGWRFVHVNVGIRSNDRVRFYFFMTDPEDFIITCYPDKPQWQLMTKKLKLKDFIHLWHCTPHMLSLGLKLVEPKHGTMKTKSGKAFVDIAAPRNVANKLIASYSLVGVDVLDKALPLRTSTLINSTMTDTIDSDSQGDFISARAFPPMLDRYVFSSTRSGHFFFDLVLPIAGVYHFDVHGELVENIDEARIEGLPLLCQLKIICLEAEFPAELDPLPASPIIGWGPGSLLSRFGMKPLSHRDGHVYSQTDEEIMIKFAVSYKLKFKIQLNHDILLTDDQKEHTEYRIADGVLIITVKLPCEGQYGLLIFAQRRNKNAAVQPEFVNICNYLIITGRQSPRTERFPKKVLRDRLDEQTTNGTCEGLQRALDAFLLHNVPDDGEVERARDKLHFFQLQKNLKDTIKRRNIMVLQQSINQATTSRYQADLEDDIQKAEEYLKKLQKLSGFLHPISKMDPRVIAEIRSYKLPKPVVRDVLMATFILLGEKEEHVQDWGFIQYLLAKSGKESLQKRIETFSSEAVPEDAITCAYSILQKHNTNETQGASNNAAAFYTWAKHICEEKMPRPKNPKEKKSKNKSKSKEKPKEKVKLDIKEADPKTADYYWNQYKRPAIKPTDKCNRIYLEYLHTREKQRKIEI